MSVRKRTRKKSNWAVRFVLVAVAAFLFIKLVQLHTQIEEKQQLIDAMDSRITTQKLINEDLEEQCDNAEKYQERHANEAGMYFPGQQIFQTAG